MARSGDFGWAGSGIWARGERLEKSKKVNLGRKWVETEDEGKSSCEKLWVVLAVFLVVTVRQHDPLQIEIHATIPNTGISDSRFFRTPRPVGHPGLGAYRTPNEPP